MDNNDLKELLDTESALINTPLFIPEDPVQFPRRFNDMRDIEIAGICSAIMAWGNRKMICRDCDRLLSLMDNSPAAFVMEEEYEQLPDEMNIHRTLFARNLKFLLRTFREIYIRYGSLDDFCRKSGASDAELPAWKLVDNINRIMRDVNNGLTDSRALPQNLDTTALKRINMALRWFVRNDGIVDMGIWESITPDKLYIPLDVHVGNTARSLGLIDRKANDKKTVLLLTDRLKEFRPEDPCYYDYALFGIGVYRK